MRPIILITSSFLRQRRWFLLAYPFLAFAIALMLTVPTGVASNEDFEFYFKQQSIYAVTVAVLLAAQANYNERKSRRILGVLSKGIERRDYLAGLLGGVFVSSGLFLIGVGLGMAWIASKMDLPLHSILVAMLLMWLACCLSAAITMFLATFLHPLLAIAGTSVLIGGGAAAQLKGMQAATLFPVYELNSAALQLMEGEKFHAIMVPVALIEIVVFWLLAGLIFNRRDIAVAIE